MDSQLDALGKLFVEALEVVPLFSVKLEKAHSNVLLDEFDDPVLLQNPSGSVDP
jgi:hypothetical protein